MRNRIMKMNQFVVQTSDQVQHLYKKIVNLWVILGQSQITHLLPSHVIKTLMMNADKYNKDMEVGKVVAKSIKDGEIPKDSLSNEHKDDLFTGDERHICVL